MKRIICFCLAAAGLLFVQNARPAVDPSRGLILANIDPALFGLPAGAYSLAEITAAGLRPLGQTRGVLQRSERLAPAEIKVIEVSPAGAQ
jgi:hypothetical protein